MNSAPSFLANVEQKYLDSSGVIAFLQAYAGFTLSRSSLYKATMDTTIPVHRGPGGRLLFPITEIRQWIENGGQIEKVEA